MRRKPEHPSVVDPAKVGTYPALAKSGAGYVWDEVLEYRVWCHPERGAPDCYDGDDYFHAFDTFDDAAAFSNATPGAEAPLALILQREHINEPEDGKFEHVREERIAEWQVEWLQRSRRTNRTIPDFFAAGCTAESLGMLRGARSARFGFLARLVAALRSALR